MEIKLMVGNSEVRIKAKKLEQALTLAAEKLNAHVDDLEYEVVSQTGGGLLFFLGRSIEIRAWKKEEKRAARSKTRHAKQQQHEQPAKDESAAELYSPEEIDALVKDLRDFCEKICSYITGEELKVTARLVDERLVLDVDSDALANLMAKNSKLAESLEHILRKRPRHIKRELPFRVFVDVNGGRREREESLVALAQDLSDKVNQNKKPIVLNYRSAYDRKIIHMALDKDERVYTRSIGHGSNRKLMILPIKDGELGEVESMD
jgi:spoIIIJ-associated protein